MKADRLDKTQRASLKTVMAETRLTKAAATSLLQLVDWRAEQAVALHASGGSGHSAVSAGDAGAMAALFTKYCAADDDREDEVDDLEGLFDACGVDGADQVAVLVAHVQWGAGSMGELTRDAFVRETVAAGAKSAADLGAGVTRGVKAAKGSPDALKTLYGRPGSAAAASVGLTKCVLGCRFRFSALLLIGCAIACLLLCTLSLAVISGCVCDSSLLYSPILS